MGISKEKEERLWVPEGKGCLFMRSQKWRNSVACFGWRETKRDALCRDAFIHLFICLSLCTMKQTNILLKFKRNFWKIQKLLPNQEKSRVAYLFVLWHRVLLRKVAESRIERQWFQAMLVQKPRRQGHCTEYLGWDYLDGSNFAYLSLQDTPG